ncbi:phospholipase, patatin family, partial [Ancylostoma ceylanicum]
ADIDTLLTIANSPPTPASATQTKTPWDYQQEAAIQVQKENKENGGERVNLLSLDGGGIRGLVVIQMLSELEKKFGADLLSSFGWLGGTSTGAILALALSQGKSVAHCRSMYFRLKDELFCGERPYDGALLDSFLRSEFGEDTTLADITSK